MKILIVSDARGKKVNCVARTLRMTRRRRARCSASLVARAPRPLQRDQFQEAPKHGADERQRRVGDGLTKEFAHVIGSASQVVERPDGDPAFVEELFEGSFEKAVDDFVQIE
jgi:hypothetical protein